jgi:uncharacterized repeat protein (TIGR03803 family)
MRKLPRNSRRTSCRLRVVLRLTLALAAGIFGSLGLSRAQVSFELLHAFTGDDGAFPTAPLIQASDGNFYGTTYRGGVSCSSFLGSCGTVFRMTPT